MDDARLGQPLEHLGKVRGGDLEFLSGSAGGDGGPAVSAGLNLPEGVAFDGSGNMYIADYQDFRVRKVNASGVISTAAGNGNIGYSGDGGTSF